jgi:hypothetical protein
LTFNSRGELFVADIYAYQVYRYKFQNGTPVSNGSIPINNPVRGDPVGVAFSPEGELFVTCHWSGGIYRFLFDENGNAIPNGYTPTVNLGGPAILPTSVLQSNHAPVADAGGPYLVAVDDSIVLNGSGSYDPDGDPLTYMWTQEEELGIFTTSTDENPIYTGNYPGITNLTLTVSDEQAHDTDTIMLVVYDPSGGFVTGGGWIWSPLGAYVDNPNLEGKANFGFVSKYQKGASTPTGQTEFVFQAGNLNFHSTSYEWLVVAGNGHKAMFKGVGTINGVGNYGFILSAIDAAQTPSTDVDLFRIKIWNKNNGDAVVYDNQMGDDEDADPTTAIGGGSIVIHTK